MPLDGSMIAAIQSEIEMVALESRIEKIYQPENNEIVLHLRLIGEKRALLLSAHPTHTRAHFITDLKTNPPQAPQFSMTLRKHLQGARLIKVKQPTFERMLMLHFATYDDLGDDTEKILIIEMMGRHSNIILVHGNQIIDSIFRIPESISRMRQLLPGRLYEMPPMGKENPLEINKEIFLAKLIEPGKITNNLMKAYNGISPLVSREIIYQSGISTDEMSEKLSSTDFENIYAQFNKYMDMVKNKQFSFTLYKDSAGKHLDFTAVSLEIIKKEAYEESEYSSASTLLEAFHAVMESSNTLEQKRSHLKKIMTEALGKCTNRMDKQAASITDSASRDDFKLMGELITAYAHEIPPHASEYIALNYYNQTDITIPLRSDKTAIENAQRYYKQYDLYKRRFLGATKQLAVNQGEKEYLQNILLSIEHAQSEIEIEEIRMELASENYLKVRKKQKKEIKPSQPHLYISTAGFSIYVGKNNLQNENLTKKAAKEDIWLHVKEMPGSHVIIKHQNEEIPLSTIEEAALLAGYYSRGRDSSMIPVDYTFVKYVKKPSGARPGFVHYTDFHTVYITATLENIQSLQKMDE